MVVESSGRGGRPTNKPPKALIMISLISDQKRASKFIDIIHYIRTSILEYIPYPAGRDLETFYGMR